MARKGARGFCTEVDRTAERMIADMVLSGARSRIIGEEFNPNW